jgi:hypothetical protein
MISAASWLLALACTRSAPDDEVWLAPRPTVSTGMIACVVDSAGQLTCWGDERWPDTGAVPDAPRFTDAPNGTFHTVSVAEGVRAACAIHTNGAMSCWGFENPVPSSAGPWKQVGLGVWGGCAVRLDGQGTCWIRDQGEIPMEGVWASLVGTTVAGEPGVRNLVACGVTAAGSPLCVGSPAPDLTALSGTWNTLRLSSQLTVCGLDGVELTCVTGSGTLRDSPVAWVSPTVGGVPCGVREDGRTTCWKYDRPNWRAQPEGIEGPWVDVSDGYPGTCALRPDDTVACWSYNPQPRHRQRDPRSAPPALIRAEANHHPRCNAHIARRRERLTTRFRTSVRRYRAPRASSSLALEAEERRQRRCGQPVPRERVHERIG